MNKSVRINKMIIYLADKHRFNLKDLMDEFNISKSTALRDISSLETIGYPIYSSPGKHGGYGILHNKMKYHVEFTNNELYALYFSIKTLQGYQSTPFHINAEMMIDKFRIMLPDTITSTLTKMNNLLQFESTKHSNDSPLLKDILFSAINEEVIDIEYHNRMYTLQVLNISSRFGQWYVTAFERVENRSMVFRCDRISSLTVNYSVLFLQKEQIAQFVSAEKKQSEKNRFEAEINLQAVDIFYKESYPSMELTRADQSAFISGYYGDNELNFILKYLLNYGDNLLSIKPCSLKEQLITYTISLENHLNNL